MPDVLDRPTTDFDIATHPVLEDGQHCHILDYRSAATVTFCRAPYDCLPRGVCSAYDFQQVCPDCQRAICPECEQLCRQAERSRGRIAPQG